jgi:hypothetical protein
MSTLAFISKGEVFLSVVVTLVLGALAWRLIWAILVTPRLDRVPPLLRPKEPEEQCSPVRVLIRDAEPETEPDYPIIEVITPREALPSTSEAGPVARPVLPHGNRAIVRRHER